MLIPLQNNEQAKKKEDFHIILMLVFIILIYTNTFFKTLFLLTKLIYCIMMFLFANKLTRKQSIPIHLFIFCFSLRGSSFEKIIYKMSYIIYWLIQNTFIKAGV